MRCDSSANLAPNARAEPVARARCIVAQAEIALASRDLSRPSRRSMRRVKLSKLTAIAFNAAYARYLELRRLLLIGRLDEAENMLADLDPAAFPPASRAAHELVVAGIAMRRLRTKAARAALARAECAAPEGAYCASQEFLRPCEFAELRHRDAPQRECGCVVAKCDALQCAEGITCCEGRPPRL